MKAEAGKVSLTLQGKLRQMNFSTNNQPITKRGHLRPQQPAHMQDQPQNVKRSSALRPSSTIPPNGAQFNGWRREMG